MGDAMDARALMHDATLRKMELEEEKKGLVIVEALYGKLEKPDLAKFRNMSSQGIKELIGRAKSTFPSLTNEVDAIIDVTIPIQSLVSNGQLHISGGHSKSGLIGFYDPCLGEDKQLRITYTFQSRLHQIQVGDKKSLAAPLRSHTV